MREKAKKIFLDLKAKDKELKKIFDEYVNSLKNELEIDEDIAIKLVTDELVNKYEKQLILRNLFSNLTLKNLKNDKE